MLLPYYFVDFFSQPPLYKIKKGQQEVYLKNEQELSEYLLLNNLDQLEVTSQNKKIPTSELSVCLKAGAKLTKALENHRRKFHLEVLRGLLYSNVIPETLEDNEKFTSALEVIKSRLEKLGAEFTYELEKDSEHNSWFAKTVSLHSGVKKENVINTEFLDSPEYEELLKHFGAMTTAGVGPISIKTKKEEFVADDGEKLVTKVIALAKAGLAIQRYKGLGEMNPDQLWETTMDPEKRTLLKVSVDDAVEADRIFSVLMGDQVDLRRQFIQENALRVKNLDV